MLTLSTCLCVRPIRHYVVSQSELYNQERQNHAGTGASSTSPFLIAQPPASELWNSRPQLLERNHVSVGTRCALRSLEPRCICGVYSSGTEHPWRSLADRSLIVCFIFSHDSHLDLNVAQTLSQEPRWETSREQRIHCAYIRYVSVMSVFFRISL